MNEYLIGLLTADGYVDEWIKVDGSSTYINELELSDEQLIKDLAKKYNKEYKHRKRIIKNKERNFYKISLKNLLSDNICKCLKKERKGIYNIYKEIKNKDDFIRGLFDGDGTICKRNSGSICLAFSINSNSSDINKIIEDYCKKNNFSLSKYFDKRGSGSWFYSINKKQDIENFAKLIYKNNDICLIRKKEKFLECGFPIK